MWTPPARITNEMQRRRLARSNTEIRDFALDTECAGACSANMSKVCVSMQALLLMFLEEHGAVLAHARPGRLKHRSYTIAMGCQIGSDIVVVLPHRARRPVLRQCLCCMIHGLRGATNSGCCASWWCMARPWIQSYPPCWRSSFRVCVSVCMCFCGLALLVSVCGLGVGACLSSCAWGCVLLFWRRCLYSSQCLSIFDWCMRVRRRASAVRSVCVYEGGDTGTGGGIGTHEGIIVGGWARSGVGVVREVCVCVCVRVRFVLSFFVCSFFC